MDSKYLDYKRDIDHRKVFLFLTTYFYNENKDVGFGIIKNKGMVKTATATPEEYQKKYLTVDKMHHPELIGALSYFWLLGYNLHLNDIMGLRKLDEHLLVNTIMKGINSSYSPYYLQAYLGKSPESDKEIILFRNAQVFARLDPKEIDEQLNQVLSILPEDCHKVQPSAQLEP